MFVGYRFDAGKEATKENDVGKPAISQSRSLLDHDINDTTNDTFNFDANFTPSHVEPPTSMVANAPSHLSFSAPGYVAYSSDVDLPPAHVPFVAMAAGSGGGIPGTATTTTSSSTLVTNGSGTGLSINVNWDSSVSSAPTGFTADVLQVAQYFVSHFTDNVTLNINVGFGESGGYSLNGALGMSLTYLLSSSYTQIKNALTADQTSAADASAVASLVGDPTSGGNYWISTAESKAMGLLTSTTNIDGSVGFSSSSGIFDHDNSNGVSSGQYDFFAVVAHEFSEVMGRMLLTGSTIGGVSNSYDVLDLFHYSAPGTHDLSGSVAGYFSADNGTTDLHNFNVSPGGDRGDWASSAAHDAFDAYGTPGVIEPISSSDLTALDAIGWNPASTAPPPPTTAPVLQFTSEVQNGGNSGKVALAGTSDTSGTVHVFDNGTEIGTASIGNGQWSFTTTKLTDAVHTFTVTENDVAGNLGTSANTAIFGSSAADTLTGGPGNDIIMGNRGNDTIIGGAGGDTLIGGAGNDIFKYLAVTDSRPGTGNFDTISDFTHGSDKIDFSAITGLTALATATSTPATIAANTIEIVAIGGNTVIYANATNASEGTASADMGIHLTGVTNVTLTDILHH
jgi:RTX calcium-binding nonapeptide repeat (4 copies)/Bacterial Ig-like domain